MSEIPCYRAVGPPVPLWFSMRNGKPSGIVYEILTIAAKKLGVCIDYVTPKSYDFGMRLSNGSWTGVIGELVGKEADLIASGLSKDMQRALEMDFSAPLVYGSQYIVYPRPGPEPNMAGFTLPFAQKTWAAVFATMVLIPLVLCLSKMLRRDMAHKSSFTTEGTIALGNGQSSQAGRQKGYRETLEEMVQWSVAVMLAISMKWSHRDTPTRILAAFWILISLIISTVYKSSLKAMLISPKIVIHFNNFQEFLDQDVVKFRIIKHTSIEQSIMNAEPGTLFDKARKRVDGYIKSDKPPFDTDSIANSDYAFIVNNFMAGLLMEVDFKKYGQCRLTLARERFRQLILHIPFAKGSPLLNTTNRVIENLREFGILDKWLRDKIPLGTLCMTPPDERPKVQERILVLEDFLGVLLLWLIGLLLGLVAFVCEVLTARLVGHYHHQNMY